MNVRKKSDGPDWWEEHQREWKIKEEAAKKEFERLGIEKKRGLYNYRGDTIDVYFVEGQGWFWGRYSDCGNWMNYQMWVEAEYIGPTTKEYEDMVFGMMKARWEYDD